MQIMSAGPHQINLMQRVHGQHIVKFCAMVTGLETNVLRGHFTTQLNLLSVYYASITVLGTGATMADKPCSHERII